MNGVRVCGVGAVSPAGWNVASLMAALDQGVPLPLSTLPRLGWDQPLTARSVPPPATRPTALNHPRLRRTSPITHYAVMAALEALGPDADAAARGQLQLGILFCTLCGSVNYSRRFLAEVLQEPATASPMLFPETVFNAPASHIAAVVGSGHLNNTLVGDAGQFVAALALARDWLARGCVDTCLVVGAEELEWLVVDAARHFGHRLVMAEGAGALYLTRGIPGDDRVELAEVAAPRLITRRQPRTLAARRLRESLPPAPEHAFLVQSASGSPRWDAAEEQAWCDWSGPRCRPRLLVGEALAAASAWQCVAAVESLRTGRAREAWVSVVGFDQQAIGARFARV